ncbi:MAG: tetratricopeptide repeat protein [Desulfovibrionales bacterium]
MKRILCPLFWILPLLLLTSCTEGSEGPKILVQADQAYLNGEYLEAEDRYQEFIRSHADHPARWEAWNRLLSISRHIRRDVGRSVDVLEAMYLEFGDHPERSREVLPALGNELIKLGEKERAATAWEKLLEIPGTDPKMKWETAKRLVDLHLSQGDIALTRAVLDTAEKWDLSGEQRAALLYESAKLLQVQGKIEQAKSELKKVSDLVDSGNHYATFSVFMLADIHEQEGDHGTALMLFESISEKYPNPGTVAKRIEALKKRLEHD